MICQWCGISFKPPNRKGPKPKYCKRAHRQRAYEERRIDRAIAEALRRAGR